MSAESRPPRVFRSRLSFAKCTSTPASMRSPRSAQSFRFRAPRSILWITRPRARPRRSSLIIRVNTGRPRFAALSRSSNHFTMLNAYRWPYCTIASFCSCSETPFSPCFAVDTRMYPKYLFSIELSVCVVGGIDLSFHGTGLHEFVNHFRMLAFQALEDTPHDGAVGVQEFPNPLDLLFGLIGK